MPTWYQYISKPRWQMSILKLISTRTGQGFVNKQELLKITEHFVKERKETLIFHSLMNETNNSLLKNN